MNLISTTVLKKLRETREMPTAWTGAMAEIRH